MHPPTRLAAPIYCVHTMTVTRLHRWVAYAMVAAASLAALGFVLLGYTPDRTQNAFPAALLGAVGFFAWASLRDRPSLLLLAGLAGMVLSPLLWSALPLLFVPSFLCLVAFARHRRPRPSPIGTTAGVVVVPLLMLLGGVVVFLRGETRQVCETLVNGSFCSDTTDTRSIVLASLCALAAAVTGYWAATPGPLGRNAPATGPQRPGHWPATPRRRRYGCISGR